MRRFFSRFVIFALLAMLCVGSLAISASAVEYLPEKEGVSDNFGKKEYSPYVGRVFPTQVCWGETHLDQHHR